MQARPLTRLALALLLLWQLQSAVAVALPQMAPAMQTSSVAGGHCVQHSGGDGPPVPQHGCCHTGSPSCQCSQLPALALLALAVEDGPLADSAPPLRSAPRAETRALDFFRPPI